MGESTQQSQSYFSADALGALRGPTLAAKCPREEAAVFQTGDCRPAVSQGVPIGSLRLHRTTAQGSGRQLARRSEPPTMIWVDGSRREKPLRYSARLQGVFSVHSELVLSVDRDNFRDKGGDIGGS
jgi:hypothetical protein